MDKLNLIFRGGMMQEKHVTEEVLGRQLKVEGFFERREYHILVKDRETGEVFKNGKANDLKKALLCLRGTGIPYPVNDSILRVEERMKKEGRCFIAWKDSVIGSTIFYLSGCGNHHEEKGGLYCEDMITLAVGSSCRILQMEDTVFKFYRKGEQSVKIIASQGGKIYRSFVGSGEDLAEAAKRALMATHPECCRKKRA